MGKRKLGKGCSLESEKETMKLKLRLIENQLNNQLQLLEVAVKMKMGMKVRPTKVFLEKEFFDGPTKTGNKRVLET
jgi:hypothetical protein